MGVGWIPEEYAAVNASWEDRGAVTDEYLDVMVALWKEDHPGFEGRFYSLPPDICFYPNRCKEPFLSGWGQQRSGPAEGRPGWIRLAWAFVSPEGMPRIREDIIERLQKRGRDPEGFVYSNRVNLEVTERNDPDHPCRVRWSGSLTR